MYLLLVIILILVIILYTTSAKEGLSFTKPSNSQLNNTITQLIDFLLNDEPLKSTFRTVTLYKPGSDKNIGHITFSEPDNKQSIIRDLQTFTQTDNILSALSDDRAYTIILNLFRSQQYNEKNSHQIFTVKH